MNSNTEEPKKSDVESVHDAEDGLEQMVNDDDRSTWAGRRTDLTIEPYTLLRYYKFLRVVAVSIIALSILFILIAGVMCVLFVLNGNFEYIFFNDGTDAICILDPKTGVVKQYE